MPDTRSPYRRPPIHAPMQTRVSEQFRALQAVISARRGETLHRFRQPSDWIRLIMLGVLLTDLAIIALANTVFEIRMTSYWPGMASIFGGLLLSIIIIRIGSPELFLDWIVFGTLQTTLGLLLTKQPSLALTAWFALFCLLLAASAALRLWIGVTLDAGNGGAWLAASGFTGFFCTFWAISCRLLGIIIDPDVVLAVDSLVSGLSIIGLGFSLRRLSS